MGTNRPRSLVRRHAGTGLEAGSGSTLDVDLSELDPKTAPVMADSVSLVDSEDGDASKIATLTNVQKILGETAAGVAAATGLTEVDGVLKVNPTDETLVPATGYLLTQNAAGAPHKDAVADVVALMAGSEAVSGLVASAGVFAVATRIAHMVADQKSSLFFEALEVDFGVATAVDEKIADGASAKGKLILAIGVVTELFDGDADNTISISNNTLLGANKMCSDIIVDKDAAAAGNWLGSVFAGKPVVGADATVASAADVYAYSAANTNRSAGKMYFLLVFMKTA